MWLVIWDVMLAVPARGRDSHVLAYFVLIVGLSFIAWPACGNKVVGSVCDMQLIQGESRSRNDVVYGQHVVLDSAVTATATIPVVDDGPLLWTYFGAFFPVSYGPPLRLGWIFGEYFRETHGFEICSFLIRLVVVPGDGPGFCHVRHYWLLISSWALL